ncbi:hypothetical protein B0H14DRAFT_2979931 [Mycena olivaceomarginata]|nr:hypothetical protein B0H14DRAFT_2979931 [Mycena olivaceomarginata]
MSSQLFQSITIGDVNHVPLLPLVKEYYTQHGSTPGTLLITESTGRGPTFELVSASDIPNAEGADSDKPRSLTVAEIQDYVELYTQAAKNAVEASRFMFLPDVSNNRTDAYGGSAENRARFPLEVVKAVVAAVGESRTSIRFSPWSPFSGENTLLPLAPGFNFYFLSSGMGMADPVPIYSHIVSELKLLHPTLAYIDNAGQSNDFIRDIWGDRPLISGGGFTRDSGIKLAEERKNSLVAYGRHFIANPDLPLRLQKNIPTHPYDRPTFYLPGQDAPTGYTDQPFATPAA